MPLTLQPRWEGVMPGRRGLLVYQGLETTLGSWHIKSDAQIPVFRVANEFANSTIPELPEFTITAGALDLFQF